MKRLLGVWISVCLILSSVSVVHADTMLIDYPENPMISTFYEALMVSWINPAGLSRIELYSVDDYKDTLITDDLSITGNKAVEYMVSGLDNSKVYTYRVVFYYQNGETYSIMLSERPNIAKENGLQYIGNWVVQPGVIPFKLSLDQSVGYDDNSSVHVAVNREVPDSSQRMVLRYEGSFSSGNYVVRAKLKYNETAGATATMGSTTKVMEGTSDGWINMEKKMSVSSGTRVFYLFIEGTTKDFWIDNFEVHKFVSGKEQATNLAANDDAEVLLTKYKEVSLPEVSVQAGNGAARILWNMYNLPDCRLNIYDKETNERVASVNSALNSVVIRNLKNEKSYTYVIKTENILTRESEASVEVTVTPKDNAGSDIFVDNSDYVGAIDEMRDSLRVKLDECEEKGISTDYETMIWRIIERDSKFFREDIAYGQNIEWNKRFTSLCELYKIAYANIVNYLTGAVVPQEVPRYLTGKSSIDENNFYGQTTRGERPIYYMGYTTADYDSIKYFSDLGFNYAHTTIEPSSVIIYGAAPYWTISAKTSDIAADGERLSISGANKVSQFVKLKGGESYSFGVSASGSGTFETKLGTVTSGTYTATEDEIVEFAISNTSGTSVFESAYVTDAKGENILQNAEFDMQDGLFDEYTFTVSMKEIFRIEKAFAEAEQNNVAISLNLSYHMIPEVVKEDTTVTSNGAVRVNPTHPRYLNSCEIFTREVLKVCGDSPALNDIIIYNEPTFYANKSTYYNEAWKKYLKENTSLSENTAMPSDDNQNSVLYTHYMRFNDSILTELHMKGAQYIRKYCDNGLIHTKIMQYLRPHHGAEYTKYSNNYEDWAEYFDVNGCDAFAMYPSREWLPIWGEGAWYDYMRSIKKAPVINSEDHALEDKGVDGLVSYDATEDDFVVAKLWQGAFHGRGASAIWTYERSPYYLYFDGGREVYSNSNMTLRPDLQYKIGKVSLDLNRLSKEVSLFQTKKKRTAVLFDPVSINYADMGMNVLSEAYASLLFMGESSDFIGEGRMDNIDDYDVVVVPFADYVSDEIFEKIQAYASKGGAVYVLGKSMTYDELGNKRTETLSGTNVKNISMSPNPDSLYIDASSKNAVRNAMKNAVETYIQRNVAVTDTAGNASTYVEYNSIEAGRYVYINLCNHAESNKSIVVKYNGAAIEKADELISGRTISGGSITLKPFETMLLRAERVGISAVIEKSASDNNTYKAVFNVNGDANGEKALLVFAAYATDGALMRLETKTVDLSETAEKSFEIPLDTTLAKRIMCTAWDTKTLSPYIPVVETGF